MNQNRKRKMVESQCIFVSKKILSNFQLMMAMTVQIAKITMIIQTVCNSMIMVVDRCKMTQAGMVLAHAWTSTMSIGRTIIAIATILTVATMAVDMECANLQLLLSIQTYCRSYKIFETHFVSGFQWTGGHCSFYRQRITLFSDFDSFNSLKSRKFIDKF